MKIIIIVGILMALLVGCAPDKQKIEPPTCFNLSGLNTEQQAWFKQGAAYWDTLFSYTTACAHSVKLGNLQGNGLAIANYNGVSWIIIFEASHDWGTCDRWLFPTIYDMPTISAHEVGHTLGLKHSQDKTNIMHTPAPPCLI